MNDEINNDGGLIWTEPKDLTPSLPEEDKYTPEAIQKTIEQMQKRKDIHISEIKEEPDAVLIMGQCQLERDRGWAGKTFSGIIARLPKA